jgi:hypothetical protein
LLVKNGSEFDEDACNIVKKQELKSALYVLNASG